MTAKRITIGHANSRQIWFDAERRSTHLHVIGGSGMGKSKFLEHMVREDILAGHGVCLIDPHGEIYRSILEWCASRRIDRFRRIHLIDPSVRDWCTGFNPLKRYPNERPLNRVDNMIEALAQVWGGENSLQTPSIRTVLRAVLTVLIENHQTLAEAFPLTRLHDEDALRAFLTSEVESPIIRELWRGYELAAAKAPREFIVEFGGPRRRLSELLDDEHLRVMFGQVSHAIDFRRCMDESDVVLVNLSEGALEESRARALGAMLLRELFMVAKQRDTDVAKVRPFYLYIDECAQYLTNDINKLLAQTRKFGLHAVLAHQWLEQLREASDAIFGAVMAIQNKVVFGGLQDPDAALIADELFRTEYDIEMPVQALIKPTVVRYVQTWLHHWSTSETGGEVWSEGSTDVQSASSSIIQNYDQNGFPVGGFTGATGTGTGKTSSKSGAQVSMSSSSEGESETYLPELEDRPSAVHSLETVRHLAIKRLRDLPKRQAIVKAPGLPSFDMRMYNILPTIVHPQSFTSFVERLLRSSPYALPNAEAKAELITRAVEVRKDIEIWQMPVLADESPDEFYSR